MSVIEFLVLILLILRRRQHEIPVPKLYLKSITFTEDKAMAKVANLVFGCEAKDANPNLTLIFKATVAGSAQPDTTYPYGTTGFPVSGIALGSEVTVSLDAKNEKTGKVASGPALTVQVPTEAEIAEPVVPEGLSVKSQDFVDA